MSQKSRELIRNNIKCVSDHFRSQFQGMITYTRTGLTEFSVLDMVTYTESEIDIHALMTYLPLIFQGICSRKTIEELLLEDITSFTCDFIEGKIFQRQDTSKFKLDYQSLAKNESEETNKSLTIKDKIESVESHSLEELYQQRKTDIYKYLKDTSTEVTDDLDIYDMRDDITSATIIRAKMDKSMDEY